MKRSTRKVVHQPVVPREAHSMYLIRSEVVEGMTLAKFADHALSTMQLTPEEQHLARRIVDGWKEYRERIEPDASNS